MGFRDLFKRDKKEVIRDNQSRGREGEEHIKSKYEFNGYKVTRTGKGHDFKAEKKDWWTGKKETKYIEVKTGNSKLSDLQKKKKRQFGRGKYVEERLDHTPFGYVSQDDTYRIKRATKRTSSKSSGFDSMFGLGGSSRSRNSSRVKNSSGFDSMFGLGGSSRPPTRRKRNDSYGFGSGLNDMFGSGNSSRKKKSSGGFW